MPDDLKIVTRLRNPPFGTETSERNLMAAAADEIERLKASADERNPCDGIFDHKWLSPSCVADGCRSLNTRTLLDQVKEMQPPDDPHSDAWHLGFARARKMAADLVRATLDPAAEGGNDGS